MREPLVSIVTPVYNGEKYIRECVESVLKQRYENWKFHVLNNCSTDGTLDILNEYAARDARISVSTNSTFLPLIENHNAAFELISPEAVYCKPLMADDWLFPECLDRMVGAAEVSSSVGLVCCYAFDGANVLWDGLPYQQMPIGGRSVGEWRLSGGAYIFGSPTSMLIRAEIIRGRRTFYNPANLHADVEACFETLLTWDFSFVYQVLAFNRVHVESATSRVAEMLSVEAGSLFAFCKFGERFLGSAEYKRHLAPRLDNYYSLLARAATKRNPPKFWEFHRDNLNGCGFQFSRARFVRAAAREVVGAVFNGSRLRSWWTHRRNVG